MAILKELYKVAKKYLILIEPAYEFASKEVKERMNSHGYCKNLKKHCENLGYKVIKHELFKYSANEQNPSAILIIKKEDKININSEDIFAEPFLKQPLQNYKNQALYSKNSLYMYPIVENIPLLCKENAVLSTKLQDFEEMDF